MGSKGQLPLDFFESVGICYGAPSNVFYFFLYFQEKIINDFEMNEVYNQCKKTLPKQNKEKQNEKKTN